MLRSSVLLLAAAVALALPAAAAAKGPTKASITGPGLNAPLAVEGWGEGDTSTPLGLLVMEGGFFPQVYSQSPNPMLKKQPKTQLGSKYEVSYELPGESSTDTLRQDLYPYATSGVVTYMSPNQVFWGTQRTIGGWFRGTAALKDQLVALGLPATDPNPTRIRIGRTIRHKAR